MKINRSELQKLLELLNVTASEEIDCDKFLDQMGAYAEALMSDSLERSAYEAFCHHLNLCPECGEEFEAYLNLLRSELDS